MVKAFERNLPLPTAYIKQLKDTQQNPHYHGEGSVYMHTLMVLENVLSLDDSWGLSKADRQILYWAAVLHDIGKPETTVWEDGRYHSHGHEAAGVPIARDILNQHKEISIEARIKILDLVRWHSIPLHMGLRNESIDAYMPWATRLDLRLLGIFAFCDLTGRICKNHEQVFDLIMHFNQIIVPAVERNMGTYEGIQQMYRKASVGKKNGLWQALSFADKRLLEKLINSDFPDAAQEETIQQCVIPIGVDARLMQSYLDKHYVDAIRIPVNKKDRAYFPQAVFQKIRSAKTLLFEGDFIDEELRGALAATLRKSGMEFHYLFFEGTVAEILKEIEDPVVYAELRKKYKSQEQIHPWEAHRISYLHFDS